MDSVFIKPYDLMTLEGRPTKVSCYRPYWNLQNKLKKTRGTWITANEYAQLKGCTVQEIEKKLTTIYQ